MNDLGLKKGYVVYTGSDRWMITPSIELVPWKIVARGKVELPL